MTETLGNSALQRKPIGWQSLTAALPAYPGGKRRLLALIFGMVAESIPASGWRQLVLADPFMGAGSVSLAAKALGFEVAANDLASRSAVVGRALIENSSVRLDPRAPLSLLGSPATYEAGDPDLLARLAPGRAAYFRSARHRLADQGASASKSLLALVVLKLLLRSFPLSLPSASDAGHAAAAEYDRISFARLGHYLSARAVGPAAIVRTTAAVNAGVIPGRGTFTQNDAFSFLPAIAADIVVLDPPYSRTQGYESAFRLVDEFLGAEAAPTSVFTGSSPPIDELLDACSHIPVLVMCAGNTRLDENDWVELVARHRTVRRVVAVPYRHYGAVASPAKNATNREFLILGVRE